MASKDTQVKNLMPKGSTMPAPTMPFPKTATTSELIMIIGLLLMLAMLLFNRYGASRYKPAFH